MGLAARQDAGAGTSHIDGLSGGNKQTGATGRLSPDQRRALEPPLGTSRRQGFGYPGRTDILLRQDDPRDLAARGVASDDFGKREQLTGRDLRPQ